MTSPLKIALVTQVLSIACSRDGQFLRVSRIARGKTTGRIELHATTLKPADAGASRFLPVASLKAGITRGTKRWTVGEFGQGLFVRRLGGKLIPAPEPFNRPTELTVTAFAISADGQWVAVGNASGFVTVLGTTSGEERWAARLHKGHVTALAFHPDDAVVYSGSASGELCATSLPSRATPRLAAASGSIRPAAVRRVRAIRTPFSA